MKKYKINEIFYSIQGEGYHAGKAAVFVRFAGCNLKCKFCDTSHEKFKMMTGKEIVKKAKSLSKSNFVVFTGGEPTLQLDKGILNLFNCWDINIETNGTSLISPFAPYWITISPKHNLLKINHANEIKLLVDKNFDEKSIFKYKNKCDFLYLQPISNKKVNINRCVKLIKKHPFLRLSLQLHKIIGVR